MGRGEACGHFVSAWSTVRPVSGRLDELLDLCRSVLPALSAQEPEKRSLRPCRLPRVSARRYVAAGVDR